MQPVSVFGFLKQILAQNSYFAMRLLLVPRPLAADAVGLSYRARDEEGANNPHGRELVEHGLYTAGLMTVTSQTGGPVGNHTDT
ncbi:hypothetical protein RUND412_000764 [Rhizina undulata]